MASSTTPTKRRAINQLADRICQLRSRVETVDAAYALQDLDPDKETIDPQTEALISLQTAHQLFKKARMCVKLSDGTLLQAFKQMEGRLDSHEATITKHERRIDDLEESQEVMWDWHIAVGEAQMIDDWIDKMVNTKTNNGMTSGGKGQSVGETDSSQRETYSTSTRIDRWADGMTKRNFRLFLEERDLLRLGFDLRYDDIKNQKRRDGRNQAVHDNQYQTYAYAMSQAAKHDDDIQDKMEAYAELFKWTYYGKSWRDAADLAKERRQKTK